MDLKFMELAHGMKFATLATAISLTLSATAQPSAHIVSPQDLSKAAQDATRAQQQNRATLQSALSSGNAKKALEKAHMNPQQVQKALNTLNDQELAQLAQRVNKAQTDFAAGSLSNHDLLVILVGIAALILIIVAVR